MDVDAILLRVDFHGVAGLIDFRQLSGDGQLKSLRVGIRDRVVASEVWEFEHRRTLCGVLQTLSVAGTEPLLIKGTGLAYRAYHLPPARFRGDTDIIVAPDAYTAAVEQLEKIGGRPLTMPAGPVGGCARHFVFGGASGFDHQIDLHFGISAHPALRDTLGFETLFGDAVELPRLSPQARTICDEHALILASLHRLKHRHIPYYAGGVAFRSADRLIWLYDIHLLSGRMTGREWQRLLSDAETAGLSGAVALGLEAANRAFATEYPSQVMTDLRRRAGEWPTRFLRAGVFGQTVMDIAALTDNRSRGRFLRELCFPSADHMRRAFAHVRPRWLPWLYAYRAARGARIFVTGNWGPTQ